ncbi:unnamed protein product [Caenorhabditis angaria]|uniref:PSP proline-rich domain-containing protein n=1 Tax=Caenorhabditis angaria TaxID=860376 RepID=A0A9P1MZL9_9PELO|nr:unnamed protein product [Caenorhabditis angaria]
MSDIEIIEISEPQGIGRKRHRTRSRNSKYRQERKDEFKTGRKRTSSGLIEDSRTMKGTETHFKDFVLDRTETPQRKMLEEDVDLEIETLTPSAWNESLQQSLLGECSANSEPPKKRFRKPICYNCDGSHRLADCEKPRDFRRISQKQSEQADEIRRRQLSYARYTDKDQKEKCFKPGDISDNLRFALGLNQHDIPEYIYRMRRMGFVKGYPPGYLKKAIKNSEAPLKFIEIADKFEKDEKEAPLLDPTKMISYMGFNGTYKKLKDLEDFKIPPIDVFCDKYQEELQILFKSQKKKEKKESKKHIKFTDDEDDCIIIDKEASETAGKCVLPGEEAEISILAKNEQIEEEADEFSRIEDETLNEGDSMFVSIGTPVFAKDSLNLPSIDAFAVGILPFEAREECTDNKGIFKRLMSKLKSKLE